MPASYWIDSEVNLVVAKLEGDVTLDELLSLQDRIRGDRSFLPTFKVLADCTGVTNFEFGSSEVRWLLDNSPFRSGARRAIIAVPGLVFGVARMVEMLSDQRGVETHVFLDGSDALRWLQSN